MSVINGNFTADHARQHMDETMIAPSADQRVFNMQAKECVLVDYVAGVLADAILDSAMSDLSARERSDIRYVAVHAVRMQHEHWRDHAHHEAVNASVQWMKTEGGATFYNLPDEKLRAIASLHASVVMTAFFGVSEGTRPMTPGAYLKVVDGK